MSRKYQLASSAQREQGLVVQCFKAELYDFPMYSHTSCSANETGEFPDIYGNSQKTTASSFHEERAFVVYATRILGTFSGNQQQYLTLTLEHTARLLISISVTLHICPAWELRAFAEISRRTPCREAIAHRRLQCIIPGMTRDLGHRDAESLRRKSSLITYYGSYVDNYHWWGA